MMINLRKNLFPSSSHPILHILWMVLIIHEPLLFLQPWMEATTAHGFGPWKWLYPQRWRPVSLMVLSRNQRVILQTFSTGRKRIPWSWCGLSMRSIPICMKHPSRINCSRHLGWSWRTIFSYQCTAYSSIMVHHMPSAERFWHEYNRILHLIQKPFRWAWWTPTVTEMQLWILQIFNQKRWWSTRSSISWWSW